jgi:purine catabolism regulator
MGYSIRNLLNLPTLKSASKTIVGEQYLDREVSWVHILEVQQNIDELLDGNEMILTTGVGIEDKQAATDFLRQLIDCKAAGLLLEIMSPNQQVGDWMLQLGKEHEFPVIVLKDIIRFIDITRECNTLIISENKQLKTYEQRAWEINDDRGLEAILDFTANFCNFEVVYQPRSGRCFCTNPVAYAQMKEESPTPSTGANKDKNQHLLSTNVIIWDRNIGLLSIFSQDRNLTSDDALLLNKAAKRVAQHIIYDLFAKEKLIFSQHSWIEDWLTSKMPDPEIRIKLIKHGVNFKKYHCLVCVSIPDDSKIIPKPDALILDNFSNNAIEEAHSIFHGYELKVVGVVLNREQIFCVIAPDSIHDIEERTKKALHDIQKKNKNAGTITRYRYAVGSVVGRYEEMGTSYKKALRVLNILKMQNQQIGFYSKLYDKLIFDLMNNDGLLTEYANDILGPILLPENADLLKTLMIFYNCNCSKQKTAEQLFIARQTMYFRLQKIQSLIGDDFDQGEKRFGLEMAVRIHYYLSSLS